MRNLTLKTLRRRNTPDEIEEIKQEISDLNVIHDLALGIAANTKGECLLKALDIAFKDKRQNGQPEKALIFTESNRTLQYLRQLLEENAFWINHTQIKYDKMNIKLKKTRYK